MSDIDATDAGTEAADAGAEAADAELAERAGPPRRRWALAGLAGTAALAGLALAVAQTLGNRGAQPAGGSEAPPALWGLAPRGSAYVEMQHTECWLREQLGATLPGIGAEACLAHCERRSECVAVQVDGRGSCTLLSACRGWADSQSGVSCLVKEQGSAPEVPAAPSAWPSELPATPTAGPPEALATSTAGPLEGGWEATPTPTTSRARPRASDQLPREEKPGGEKEVPTKVQGAKTVSFYLYRAQSDQDYPMENVNAGDLPGVLWYLQHEVVTQCPRKYDISRVLRVNFTAKLNAAGRFGPFVAFDSGKCTVPNCDRIWKRRGYRVGCQRAKGYGSVPGHWYSLPGACPSQHPHEKTLACAQAQPGGACQSLEDLHGDGPCTFYTEAAGEVDLNHATGIHNYTAFCAAGNVEWSWTTDRGRGMGFWDGSHNDRWNDLRLQRFQELFRAAYPDMPESFGEPSCAYRA